MQYISYIIISTLAIICGQVIAHLNRKMPPVVSEEITYKEFFSTLFKDFKIDIKYTIICLVLFNCYVYFIGGGITTYLYVIISIALFIAFSIDYRYQLIPDETHIIILIAGLINFILNINLWWDYLLGALIGAGVFYGLGLLSLLIFKKEGMGFGDVKLMGAIGFMFGIKYTLVITLVSFFLGAIIGGTLLVIKKKDIDGYIPFGPFIVIATLMLMFIKADYIIEIYITFCSWLGMKMSDLVYLFLPK